MQWFCYVIRSSKPAKTTCPVISFGNFVTAVSLCDLFRVERTEYFRASL
jgi:hypothetical protein